MSSAGCASGSADLRKGKNCWAAAAGRGVRKCEEVAVKPPMAARKEGRKCSRHGAEVPYSPGEAHGEESYSCAAYRHCVEHISTCSHGGA